MSLGKLSTELDAKVAEFLEGDTKALSAFSQVSKYYRAIAEPYLYSNIECSGEDRYTLLQLLLTLLDRNDLALHVRSLELKEGMPRRVLSDKQETDAYRDFWKRSNSIHDLLDHIVRMEDQTGHNAQEIGEWFGQLFSRYAGDSIFTLLLCLAKNIETLSLYEQEDINFRCIP